MATIRDIAKECGVSAMTVSSVLKNKRGAASLETRSRILRVAKEFGYAAAPAQRASAPRRPIMNTISVVFGAADWESVASDRYYGPLLDGVIAASRMAGQRLLIVTEEGWERACEQIESDFPSRCDGLILMLPNLTDDRLVSLVDRGAPLAIVGESRTDPDLTVVDLDNVAAGYDAASYLLELGHRRIAYLKGEPGLLSSAERETGFRDALSEWGMVPDESLIVEGRYNTASGYKRTRELFAADRPDRPTALFCGDDWIALGALQAILEQGLRVPGDVSVIGVNNDRECTLCQPGLTTIDNPLRQIGQRAVEAVLAQVAHGRAPGEKALLRGELIIRGSVAPPAGSVIALAAEFRP